MLTKCPCCNISWQSPNRIIDDLRVHSSYSHYTEEQLIEAAASYGDTEETPRHFGENVVMIEDRDIYDGALLYKCLDCGVYTGRFSGKMINSEYTPQDENNYRRALWYSEHYM